jgi:hypothetical protein
MVFVCILTVLLSQATGLAQNSEALNSEWLAKDIEAIQLISRIMPLENQSIDYIKNVLNIDQEPDEEDLGLGAKRYYLSKGSGYTSIRIYMFLVNGQVGYYKLQADGSSDYWKQIRKKL